MLAPTQYFLCFALFSGAVCSTLLTQSASGAEQYRVYVGTYTRGSDSKGIYQLLLDGKTGKLTHVDVTENSVNPSFLAISPNQKYLYAVNEINDFESQKAGAVSAYSIAADSGKLTFLNQHSSRGGSPCHLVVDATGKFVLVANYSGGNICTLPIQKDGSLGRVCFGGGSRALRLPGPSVDCRERGARDISAGSPVRVPEEGRQR